MQQIAFYDGKRVTATHRDEHRNGWMLHLEGEGGPERVFLSNLDYEENFSAHRYRIEWKVGLVVRDPATVATLSSFEPIRPHDTIVHGAERYYLPPPKREERRTFVISRMGFAGRTPEEKRLTDNSHA